MKKIILLSLLVSTISIVFGQNEGRIAAAFNASSGVTGNFGTSILFERDLTDHLQLSTEGSVFLREAKNEWQLRAISGVINNYSFGVGLNYFFNENNKKGLYISAIPSLHMQDANYIQDLVVNGTFNRVDYTEFSLGGRTTMGYRLPVTKTIDIDLAAGYSFNKFNNGPFAKIGFGFAF